jgi:hypothetical protein
VLVIGAIVRNPSYDFCWIVTPGKRAFGVGPVMLGPTAVPKPKEIRKVRTILGLSQADVARYLGTSAGCARS